MTVGAYTPQRERPLTGWIVALVAMFAIAVAAWVWALWGSNHINHHIYPVNVQANFLNSCEAGGGSVARCGCVLDYLEQHMPLGQFQTADADAIKGSDPLDRPAFNHATAACAGR